MTLVEAARARPDAVAHLGLRTTSSLAEDALALAATRGRWTGAELRAHDGLGHADLHEVLRRSVRDVDAAAALALLWSGRGTEDLLLAGARAYAWLTGTGRLPARALHHQAAAQSMYLAGLVEELRASWEDLSALPGPVRHDLETDLAHPDLVPGAGAAGHERWVELLGRRFVQHGLSAPAVDAAGEGHLFDRIRSTTQAARRSGPLVTVIVPSYRPDEGLLTSVRSMTDQTWGDLEVLLVDDASGPGFEELYEAVTTDPRVRLLRLERNGGSYLARRAALEVARGELVTTQDADDWSHPERIEHQVDALLGAPGAPASRSLAIRAKDDLTHQWFGYRAVRDNASSLLVRREVLSSAGTFWPIRKSADSEYAERLARLVGPVAETGSPLAVTRLRVGSLSRADFTYQWSNPDRIAFRGVYRAWHRTLSAATSGEGVCPAVAPRDADLPEAPPAFARGLEGTRVSPDHLDLCLVGDWSTAPDDPRHAALLEALDALADRPVGLWHVERPLAARTARPEMHDGWYDLVVAREHLHVVTRTRTGSADRLVVTDPDVLLTAVEQPATLTAGQVDVVLTEELAEPGTLGLPLDLLAVSDACRTWWGLRPRWVVLTDGSAQTGRAAVERVTRGFPGLAVTATGLAGRR